MTTKAEMRVTALHVASGHGLPPDHTLEAARKYLAFLEGTEKGPSEWVLAAVAELSKKRPPIKKAAAKKAVAFKRA